MPQNSPDDVIATLRRKSLDELKVLAKKLLRTGYSSQRKEDLVASIASSDPKALQRLLFPTWWDKHQNHVYGVASIIALPLGIAFYIWPFPGNSTPAEGRASRVVAIIEKPIRFADYTAMTPSQKENLFAARRGEPFVWEGYLSKTVNFNVQTQMGVPFEVDLAVLITPAKSSTPQISAECRFGKLLPTDDGRLLASQLDQLDLGQRVRLSGKLGGKAENPILEEARLEAVFPVED